MAVVVIIAGGIAWWLARGCVVTIVGAAGAIVGGLAALGSLVVLLDPEVALRAAPLITAASGVWLLAWRSPVRSAIGASPPVRPRLRGRDRPAGLTVATRRGDAGTRP